MNPSAHSDLQLESWFTTFRPTEIAVQKKKKKKKWYRSLPSWITHVRPDGTITSGGENRISERILSEPPIIGDPVKVVCRSSAPILSSTLSKRGRVETRTTRRVVKIASYVAGLVGRTHRPIAIAMIRGGPAIAKRWLVPVVLVFRMDDQAGAGSVAGRSNGLSR